MVLPGGGRGYGRQPDNACRAPALRLGGWPDGAVRRAAAGAARLPGARSALCATLERRVHAPTPVIARLPALDDRDVARALTEGARQSPARARQQLGEL